MMVLLQKGCVICFIIYTLAPLVVEETDFIKAEKAVSQNSIHDN